MKRGGAHLRDTPDALAAEGLTANDALMLAALGERADPLFHPLDYTR